MNHWSEIVTIDNQTRFEIEFGLETFGVFAYLRFNANSKDNLISDLDFARAYRAAAFLNQLLAKLRNKPDAIDDAKDALPDQDFDFERGMLAIIARKTRQLRQSIDRSGK